MSVLIIDLHNLAHRASHAYAKLWVPATETHTGMYYGTFLLLQKYVEQFQPDHVWIVSDPNEPSERRNWRSDYLPTYKRREVKRSAEDEKKVNAIRRQMPILKAALLLTNVFWMEQAHLEADEIIGWLWKAYPDSPFTLVSTDKDMLTLLRPNFRVYYPGQRRELMVDHTNFAAYNGDFIPGNNKRAEEDRYNFPTIEAWAEFRRLTGDASDMIPGLPKCGPAGAQKIIDAGGYKAFLTGLAVKKKPSKSELNWASEEAQKTYALNKFIMAINPPPEHVQFDMTNPRCAVGTANFEALSQWMQTLAFSTDENSLINRLRSSPLLLPKATPYSPLRQW